MYRFHTRQAKYQAVQKVLGNEHRGADLPKKLPRRVIRVPMVGKPKLFGGTIDEYVEATKEEIPPIILSCIRVLNQYGKSSCIVCELWKLCFCLQLIAVSLFFTLRRFNW